MRPAQTLTALALSRCGTFQADVVVDHESGLQILVADLDGADSTSVRKWSNWLPSVRWRSSWQPESKTLTHVTKVHVLAM